MYLVCIIQSRGEEAKRRDLIKLLEANGRYYKRNGGDHDIYTDGSTSSQSHGSGKSKKVSQRQSFGDGAEISPLSPAHYNHMEVIA